MTEPSTNGGGIMNECAECGYPSGKEHGRPCIDLPEIACTCGYHEKILQAKLEDHGSLLKYLWNHEWHSVDCPAVVRP